MSDEEAIDNFAMVMKEKMQISEKKGRKGWEDESICSNEYLSRSLKNHVEKGDPVDVANFCMMLYHRGEYII